MCHCKSEKCSTTQWVEIEQFHLCQLSRKVVPAQPCITGVVLLPEKGIHHVPHVTTHEDDTIIHIHAQCSVKHLLCLRKEGGCVQGGEDQGDG